MIYFFKFKNNPKNIILGGYINMITSFQNLLTLIVKLIIPLLLVFILFMGCFIYSKKKRDVSKRLKTILYTLWVVLIFCPVILIFVFFNDLLLIIALLTMTLLSACYCLMQSLEAKNYKLWIQPLVSLFVFIVIITNISKSFTELKRVTTQYDFVPNHTILELKENTFTIDYDLNFRTYDLFIIKDGAIKQIENESIKNMTNYIYGEQVYLNEITIYTQLTRTLLFKPPVTTTICKYEYELIKKQ